MRYLEFYGLDNIKINDYVTTEHTSTTSNNGFKIIDKCFRLNEAKHLVFNLSIIFYLFFYLFNFFYSGSNSRRLLLSSHFSIQISQ